MIPPASGRRSPFRSRSSTVSPAPFGPRITTGEPGARRAPGATRAVEEIIGRIAARGTTIVMTTHDLGQARRLAGEVVFLRRGRVVEAASAERFFAGPASAEGAAFLQGELLW